MDPFIAKVTLLVSLGAIGAQVFVVALLFSQKLRVWVAQHFLILGFVVSLGAGLGSLFYSSIAHFPPCVLCWWQRVFLFPQIFIFGLALWHKHKTGVENRFVVLLTLMLSTAGILVALYQNVGKFLPSLLEACGATGLSCSVNYFTYFNYIDIPMLSLTTFAVLIGIGVSKKYN